MRSDSIVRHLAVAFLIAVVFYFGFFSWLQHRRTFRGPWVITFASDAKGQPSLRISEAFLKISESITFPEQKITATNLDRTFQFQEAQTNIPFGKLLFQDPTFLPGTVAMSQFGHEIQLLPRFLMIDKKEMPWEPGKTVELH